MKIIIKGFKCHVQTEIEFTENSMTLVKGPSGVGKSSILQAIMWALYGNMRNIYHNAKVTKELSVILEINGLTIFRKKNPELLTVNYNEQLYEDAIAQSVIDNLWGNRDVWRACCYIEQQSRCSLLSGSAAERLDLLNSLSFTGDQPQTYLKAISNKLKQVTQTFTERQASLNTEIEIYSQQLTDKPVTTTSKDVSEIVEKLELLSEREKQLHQEVLAAQQNKGRLKYLHFEIEKLQKSLLEEKAKVLKEPQEPSVKVIEIPESLYVEEPEVEKVTFDFTEYSKKREKLSFKIKSYEQKIKTVNERLSILKPELEKQQEKIVQIPNAQELVNNNITDEMIWKAQQVERDLKQYHKLCQELNIEYSETSLVEQAKTLSHQVEYLTGLQAQVATYRKLLSVQEQIEGNEILEVENIDDLVVEKRNLIEELKRGLEVLSCPECQASLRYLKKTLEKADVGPVTPEQLQAAQQDYNDIISLKEKMKRLESLQNNSNLLKQSLTDTEEDIQKFNSEHLATVKKRLDQVKKIRYIEALETCSADLEEIQKFQKTYFEIVELEEPVPDIKQEKDELEVLEKEYQKAKEQQRLYDQYQERERKRLTELKKHEALKKRQELETKKFQEEVQKYRNALESRYKELERLDREIETKKTEIGNIFINDSAELEHGEVQKEVKQLQEQMRSAKYGDQMIERGKELGEKREELMKLYGDLETLTRLKHKAGEAECQQLEETVANINAVLEQTLPIFFSDPIELRFSLYKKLKSKDQVKPGLNLEIVYKGCIYDGLNQLSGGEGDRVSLAVLLALNSVSNSPLLLLDECVASLDSELKESCISAIKAIPNKTVICVDHDDTLEGFYDAVVSL